jgi:hypothetical protein
MKIIDVLIKKISDFKIMSARKPSAIYLGRLEIHYLKEESYLLSHYKPPLQDLEFEGIKIYPVDLFTYIGIGS